VAPPPEPEIATLLRRLASGGSGPGYRRPSSVAATCAIIGSLALRFTVFVAGKLTAGDQAAALELASLRLSGQPPPPRALDELPLAERPRALDRAPLESAVGAGRFPGIEAGQIMLDPNTYDPQRPFRINKQLSPGALTERMAVPWQADFRDCEFESGGFDWWPGQRPNKVYREDGTNVQHPWRPDSPEWDVNENVEPPITIGRETMVAQWSGLGFVVKKEAGGETKFVEAERTLP